MSKNEKTAKTSARVSPISGVAPPRNRQFGQPGGNPQGRGFWKKEDTARYKLEQMMKLSERKLVDIYNDADAPLFERKLARCIKNGEWKELEGMMNQTYGYPKQEIEQKNIELKPILPKPKKEKK